MTAALLRWTGVSTLISFYRFFYFNAPRATAASGILLLFGIAAIRAYLLIGNFAVPNYLAAYFALIIAGAVLASVAMVIGRRPGLTRIGWALGSLVSASSIGMYMTSHIAGLPGLSQLVGRWDYPLGSFAMAIAALFLALHFSVLTGMNVAYPERRHWHD